MDDERKEDGPRQVRIKATDEKLAGEYANLVKVLHTKEEFVMDFLSVFPPTGTLNARIIVSPGHFKRMLAAMTENLRRYEARFGALTPSEEPEHVIGFRERESGTDAGDGTEKD